MRIALLILVISTITFGTAIAGPCDHAWQTAKDGSSAADEPLISARAVGSLL